MGTFKIICQDCGKEVVADDKWITYPKCDIALYSFIGDCLSLECDCGNRIRNFTGEVE